MKTTKNTKITFTWKRGLCAAAATLMLTLGIGTALTYGQTAGAAGPDGAAKESSVVSENCSEVTAADLQLTEATPVKSVPAESTPVKSVPAESTPAESTPAESTPAESAPAESAPAESVPVESVPVESVPAESAPVESAPAESVPVESTDLAADTQAEAQEPSACSEDFASDLTVLPGSTTEQYAQEKGFDFGPIEEDREAVVDFLSQAGNEHKARVAGVVASDEGYLVKIVKTDPVQATEEEFRQAIQSGSITLAGTVYRFTGSEEQARAWDDKALDLNYEGAVAWIRDEATGQNYCVLKEEEGYIFRKTALYPGSGEAKLVELHVIGWIRLDADTRFSTHGGLTTLEGFLAHGAGPWPWDWDICSLQMDEAGEFLMVWETAGKR